MSSAQTSKTIVSSPMFDEGWKSRAKALGINLRGLVKCPRCNAKAKYNMEFDDAVYGWASGGKCFHCGYSDAEGGSPSWIARESNDLTRRHRVLPSGDVEFADEYGGY